MMEILPDARFNFIFAAPDDLPVWELSLDVLTEALHAVDPQADIRREQGHGWFDASFPFGGAEGSMDPTMITLQLANTEMASHFVLWLRTHVLPAEAGIAFMTHEAVELHEQPCALPDSDDRETVENAMLAYLQTVMTAYNS